MILVEPISPPSAAPHPESTSDLPPSYESVLNAEFGDPTPSVFHAASPPLPPIPDDGPLPEPHLPTLHERHSAPTIPQMAAGSQRRRRAPSHAPILPARNPTRPRSTVLPRQHGEHQARQRAVSLGRPLSRRSTSSPGPTPVRRESRARRVSTTRQQVTMPRYSQTLPSRSQTRGRPPLTPNSPQDLLDLAAFRRKSFFCSSKKTAQLVRQHAMSFLMEESHKTSVAETLTLLDEACSLCKLTLGTVLSETKVDGHPILYWAVVQGRPDATIQALLKYIPSPMDDEMRQAALTRSDWRLFQRIRIWLGMGGKVKVDERVDGKGFTVHFQNLSMETGVEFIATGRMWRLDFSPGTMSLSLLSTSAPTFVDGVFLDTSRATPSYSVPLKSAQMLRPGRGKDGKSKHINASFPMNARLEKSRLDVRLVKPTEDSSCVIC
ncbi:hypothetical protein CYLTODRAFT_417136 [Cylindrobasidium torrendii FP15055 ss-10]|uniref:Uncharacterized protein n=1 Tax=Cylindrobasidium torrendii FP15055 ss-10 TaxID=1314674 RepID=A0A0D7BSB8_9AGAR|nr:hypothetical protein CYLTODRAFT_417136 [Cylindrobasidium torrendii FP15055 ss-10]